MAGHVYHHFVPRFSLSGWTTNHRLRADAADDLRRRLMEQPDDYDALRGPNDPATLFDFMEQHRRPRFVADFGIRMLPDLMNHAPIARAIFQMYWWAQRFDRARSTC